MFPGVPSRTIQDGPSTRPVLTLRAPKTDYSLDLHAC